MTPQVRFSSRIVTAASAASSEASSASSTGNSLLLAGSALTRNDISASSASETSYSK